MSAIEETILILLWLSLWVGKYINKIFYLFIHIDLISKITAHFYLFQGYQFNFVYEDIWGKIMIMFSLDKKVC